MDYSQIIAALKEASLFDLYRLSAGINAMMDDPMRIRAVKRNLRSGQVIHYYLDNDNMEVAARVLEVSRNKVKVEDLEGGKRWAIPFYMINLQGADTEIRTCGPDVKLDKNHLKTGEFVGFRDNQEQERYGRIIRRNQKTVTLETDDSGQWRVPYSRLFKVVDGDAASMEAPNLIEGEVVSDAPHPMQSFFQDE
ncbi:hypothetical protein [Magnetococcus marinus]|uniref:hypothetical protein n=1 Tax=Magnetococcus marinus TaxID=1124597 RepID=UPI000673FC19|nr:hypothetical protein [Magnetococcus marinus]